MLPCPRTWDYLTWSKGEQGRKKATEREVEESAVLAQSAASHVSARHVSHSRLEQTAFASINVVLAKAPA